MGLFMINLAKQVTPPQLNKKQMGKQMGKLGLLVPDRLRGLEALMAQVLQKSLIAPQTMPKDQLKCSYQRKFLEQIVKKLQNFKQGQRHKYISVMFQEASPYLLELLLHLSNMQPIFLHS